MDNKELRDTLVAIRALQDKLENETEELTKKLQKQCKHPVIIETDYVPNDYGAAMPPLRICVVCALEEEGWGCGYQELDVEKPFKEVSRDEFYEYRTFKALENVALPKVGAR